MKRKNEAKYSLFTILTYSRQAAIAQPEKLSEVDTNNLDHQNLQSFQFQKTAP